MYKIRQSFSKTPCWRGERDTLTTEREIGLMRELHSIYISSHLASVPVTVCDDQGLPAQNLNFINHEQISSASTWGNKRLLTSTHRHTLPSTEEARVELPGEADVRGCRGPTATGGNADTYRRAT